MQRSLSVLAQKVCVQLSYICAVCWFVECLESPPWQRPGYVCVRGAVNIDFTTSPSLCLPVTGVQGGSVHTLYPGLSKVLPSGACVYLQTSKHGGALRLWVVHSLIQCVLTIQKRWNARSFMTYSLLCYFILALCNDQPNGWVNGKCGWILVSHWNLCGGSTSVQTRPSSHFLLLWSLKEKRNKMTLDYNQCLYQNQEPAHLLQLLNQTVWLACKVGGGFFAVFPQQMDLLRQAWRPSSSSSSNSGLTGLSCLVIAAPVLFACPRWNVITVFGE